ncbi:transposase [Bradyrhizobium japonicum]|nr:transposase [Bradyrhizobium japonicum]MCS3957086.1 transposase [Bradyrhizobium japonicum]MCS3998835.1 transposase [Bradyrhizobium japonicum]
MRRFVEEADRGQRTLLPECLDDFIDESNPVRVIDVFVDALDLAEMGFEGVEPAATGRPSYHPALLLKLYIYGYLNRVQSSRRLEREAGRNVEVMWLLGWLAPDHKTIADFRKDNGLALRKVCARFVELCRDMGLLATASVAIDGSKFKAVNNRDRNFTRAKVERRPYASAWDRVTAFRIRRFPYTSMPCWRISTDLRARRADVRISELPGPHD